MERCIRAPTRPDLAPSERPRPIPTPAQGARWPPSGNGSRPQGGHPLNPRLAPGARKACCRQGAVHSRARPSRPSPSNERRRMVQAQPARATAQQGTGSPQVDFHRNRTWRQRYETSRAARERCIRAPARPDLAGTTRAGLARACRVIIGARRHRPQVSLHRPPRPNWAPVTAERRREPPRGDPRAPAHPPGRPPRPAARPGRAGARRRPRPAAASTRTPAATR